MPKCFKKLLSVFLCVCCLLALGGCKEDDTHGLSKEDPINISLWHYYNGTQAIAFEKLIDEFNSTEGAEKGIVVSAKSQSSISDLVTALEDSANKKAGADDLPNIFQCYLDTAVVLDKQGYITPLNKYITQEEMNKFMDSYIEEGCFDKDGQLKLFPMAKSTEVLIVNKTDWDPFANETKVKFSDLSTWEGLNKVAKKYYEWSNGRSFFGRDAFANYMIVGSKQLGQEIFTVKDDKVTVNLNKKIMKKLWDNYYIPYVKGYYKHVGRYRTDDVKTGDIIAEISSTTGTAYFPSEVTIGKNDPYAIQYVVLPIPNFEGRKKYIVQQGASMAVTKKTEAEEYASVVFLKWMTENERNIEFSVLSGYLPVKKEINNTNAITEFIDSQMESKVSGVLRDSILTSIEEIQTSQSFTSVGFIQGNEARNLLENSMMDEANNALEEIKKGKKLKSYLSDDKFNAWYDKLVKQMKEVCQ